MFDSSRFTPTSDHLPTRVPATPQYNPHHTSHAFHNTCGSLPPCSHFRELRLSWPHCLRALPDRCVPLSLFPPLSLSIPSIPSQSDIMDNSTRRLTVPLRRLQHSRSSMLCCGRGHLRHYRSPARAARHRRMQRRSRFVQHHVRWRCASCPYSVKWWDGPAPTVPSRQ